MSSADVQTQQHQDLGKKINQGIRKRQHSYSCPNCKSTLTPESRLWRHIESEHPQLLEGLSPQDKREKEKLWQIDDGITENVARMSLDGDDAKDRQQQQQLTSASEAEPKTPVSPNRPRRRNPNNRSGKRDAPSGRGRGKSAEIDSSDFRRAAPTGERKLFDPNATQRPGSGNAAGTSSPATNAPKTPRTKPKKSPAQHHTPLQSPRGHPSQPHLIMKKPTDSSLSHNNNTATEDEPPEKDPVLFNQPITKPISQEQLIAEVKGIYAGLVMVEAKCIEVDSRQARAHALSLDQEKRKPLNNEQWQALIALHRTLLHEHHDFFLASQHPAASDSLKRLANKYAMPARMWRHGIHSFLELLRHRLPESFEHMLSFLYLSYSMMALLYETVPNFADTWVECLGDLGRYRMAIEEGDIRDREVWTNVSRGWYSKGSDRCPHIGRLYHHQAILSRPNVLQQLFYYSKSLTVSQPFSSARESILTLFEPFISQRTPSIESPANDFDNIVIRISSIIFQCVNLDDFEDLKDLVLDKLEPRIEELASKFKVQGVYLAVSTIAGIFQFGSKTSLLKGLLKEEFESRLPGGENQHNQQQNPLADLPLKDREQLRLEHRSVLEAHEGSLSLSMSASDVSFVYAVKLTFSIFQTILLRQRDANCHCFVHSNLIFLNFLLDYPKAMGLVVYDVPWQEIAEFANTLLQNSSLETAKFNDIDVFPSAEKSILRPLTEDYLLRGLEMAKSYFPKTHFSKQLDEEERLIELPSMGPVRVERILWLIMRISEIGSWLDYNKTTRTFSVSSMFLASMDQYRAAADARDTQPTSRHEDSDVEMEDSAVHDDVEEPDSGDEGNQEVRELVNKHRELKRMAFGPMEEDKKEEQPAKQAPPTPLEEMVKPNYTVVIADTNALIKMPDTFYAMLNSTTPWQLLVPYSVVTELSGLGRNEGTVASQAKHAEQMLDQAVSEKKSVKVVTAKGHIVTNIKAHYKERVDFAADKQNLDDVILSTARAEGSNVQPRPGYEKVKPVIFITDDGLLRVKAHSHGVTAVSTKDWTMALANMSDDGALKRKSIPRAPGDNGDLQQQQQQKQMGIVAAKKRIKQENHGASTVEVG